MASSFRNSLGSLAAVAALAVPAVTQAQIVVSQLEPTPLPFADWLYIDVNGDGADDLSIYSNSSAPTLEVSALNGAQMVNAGSFHADPLAQGTLISAATEFSSETLQMDYFFGDSAYLGLSMVSGGETFYGWVGFDFTNVLDAYEAANGFIFGAAWQSTPGEAIAAGAIPEPSTTATLLGLAAGAVAWLRRRFRAA